MALQTSIANALDFAGDAAKLDAHAKKIFSHKAILAPLLRMCIPEFSEFEDEFIIRNCFEGDPIVSAYPVHQDESDKLNGNQRITQMNSEEAASAERTIYYDIRFTAKVPLSDDLIHLIINLEIQVSDNLKYKVVTRGIYYCARMISAQYGTVFTNQDYQKIRKVYSIWICPESETGQHSITEYRLQQDLKLGNVPAEAKDYDKFQVIVITLGPDGSKSEDPLIRFLSLLLSREGTLDSRKEALEKEYKIEMNETLEEEMSIMCNLGEGIARRVRAQSLQEGFDNGQKIGNTQGEDRMASLVEKLNQHGRYNDIVRSATDPVYRQKLFREFNLISDQPN